MRVLGQGEARMEGLGTPRHRLMLGGRRKVERPSVGNGDGMDQGEIPDEAKSL